MAHLFDGADERNHDLEVRIAAVVLDVDRGLEDGARLHLGNLGERDAEAASAQAEHGVDLVQFLHAGQQRAQFLELGRARLGVFKVRDFDQQIFALGQELMQRRIEQADGDRQRFHGLEEADKVGALHGQQLLEGVAALLLVLGQNHGAHVLDAAFGKEHVLGAAQADAFGAEQARLLGVAGDVGVGANPEPAHRVDPAHELDQVGIVGPRRNGLELAVDDAAGGAVERNPIALLEGLALDAEFLAGFVDGAVAGAGHAALAHAAGNDGRVRRHAAARGENAGGNFHAADVLRRGFAADQDDGGIVAIGVVLDGVLGGEDDLADRRAGRGGQAGGKHFDLGALFIETRNQEVVELVGLDAEDGFFLGDEAFADHVDGDAYGGQAGALAVASLQHVELAILDGELEVLHIAIMLFHLPGNGAEMVVDLGHDALEFADGQRRAHAGDNVFALRVHQVLAEEHALAGWRDCG